MFTKRNVTGLLFCCLTLSSVTQADTILGIYLSASAWKPDITGTIDNTGPEIDLNNTLGYTDEDADRLSFRLEHPIPLLPNIGIERYSIDSASVATLNESILYDGTVYNINETISSQIDLSHQSLLLYYEVLDNWISLDLGLDIMLFDGLFALESTSSANSTEIDETIPALYAMAQFEFPTTDISVGATVSYIGYDDNDITKTRLYLGWESELGLGVEVGLQTFDAQWEDINLSNGDLSFEGAYTSVTYHF